MSFAKRFLSDKGSYPVLVCVGAGVMMAGMFSGRHLLYAPDVRAGTMKSSLIKQDHDESAAFYAHPIRKAIVGEERMAKLGSINKSIRERDAARRK